MRITCYSLSDFLDNIRDRGATVYEEKIYVNKNLISLSKVSDEVVLQASAVLSFADGGQALLQCAQKCGLDRRTNEDGCNDGTEGYERYKEILKKFCLDEKLKILPGILDM